MANREERYGRGRGYEGERGERSRGREESYGERDRWRSEREESGWGSRHGRGIDRNREWGSQGRGGRGYDEEQESGMFGEEDVGGGYGVRGSGRSEYGRYGPEYGGGRWGNEYGETTGYGQGGWGGGPRGQGRSGSYGLRGYDEEPGRGRVWGRGYEGRGASEWGEREGYWGQPGMRGYEEGMQHQPSQYWGRSAQTETTRSRSWARPGMGRETERGRYFGRGPKGYRRSDERIREDVADRLTWNPDIDASDIEVRVENGVVTLTGVVEDRAEKRAVEDAIEDVLGIEDIRNELKVRRGFLAAVTGEKVSEEEAEESSRRRAARTGGNT